MAKRNTAGIARTEFGHRAYVRVRGRLYTKRFPPDATITDMQDWRAATRTDVLRKERAAPTTTGQTFADDVDTYLAAVKSMPTYTWREADMDAWVAALGGERSRLSFASAEIRRVLHDWKIQGRQDGGPLSESACNHRRTALMHFFTVLNGKGGTNPVRDIPRFREPDPQPRGLSFPQLRKMFRAMPESKTKARALIMAFTGLPHSTLMRLTPDAVDYKAKTLTVPRRRKGAGTKTRVLPLSPEAIRAFKLLTKYDGWGTFSRDSLRRSIHRACTAAKVPIIRGYDLRHSFGTAAYKASGDIRAVQALLDHSDVKLTERYTLGAVDARMRSAVEAMRKVASGVTSSRKRTKR